MDSNELEWNHMEAMSLTASTQATTLGTGAGILATLGFNILFNLPLQSSIEGCHEGCFRAMVCFILFATTSCVFCLGLAGFVADTAHSAVSNIRNRKNFPQDPKVIIGDAIHQIYFRLKVARICLFSSIVLAALSSWFYVIGVLLDDGCRILA